MRALLTGIRAFDGRDLIALAIEIGAVGLLVGGVYGAAEIGGFFFVLLDRAL